MKTYLVHLALFVGLAVATPAFADNVIYSNVERDLAPANSLIFDRNGALYPDASVDIPVEALQVEVENPFESLSLKGYYRDRFNGDAWKALLASVQLESTPADFDAAWDLVQGRLQQRSIARIDAATEAGQRPLFILVQGFNNTFMEAHEWYRLARRDISARVPDAVFVEVFWDGGEHPIGAPVWGLGQNNFRLVGLEFRRILGQIHPDTKIRIITHSSGGPLVANALGNASAPFVNDRDDAVEAQEHYFSRAAAKEAPYAPIHRKHLRIAMIVPAGAGNTFQYFDDKHAAMPERLILGLNPRDFVVHKAMLGCKASGDTCLATDPANYCVVRQSLSAAYPTGKVLGFNFSNSANGTSSPYFVKWEDHAMLAYMKREDWPKLLDALINDAEPKDETAALCSV